MLSPLGRAVLKHLEDDLHIDPLLGLLLMIDSQELEGHTHVGRALLRCVETCAGRSAVRAGPQALAGSLVQEFRGIFYGTHVSGVRGVRRLKASMGSIVEGKKAEAMRRFTRLCQEVGRRDYCASLVQIVFPSGARVHEVFMDAEECILSCRDRLMGGGVLAIIEVPNPLQLVQKFYIDWDLLSMVCTEQGSTDQLQRVRSVALQTPRLVYEALLGIGALDEADHLQVVVKEGSRWRGDRGCHKVSMHFVFQIILTRRQFHCMWSALLDYFGSRCQEFRAMIGGTAPGLISEGLERSMGAYLPLVGVDLHPYSNAEQGLSMPYSRKKCEDPPSRPVHVMHFSARQQAESEVPDGQVWSPGMTRVCMQSMNPSHVAWALLDSSICIPGPRCIGAREGAWSARTSHPAGAPKRSQVCAGPLDRRVRGSGGAAPSEIAVPGWFSSALQGTCGADFMSASYKGFPYGSRPSSASPRSVLFQLNKSPACICILSAMR